MATENDFLTFAASSNANVVSQSTFVSLSSLTANGFVSGIAASAQYNKVFRQSSIMASMLAQFIVDTSGQPAIDDGTTSTLETNLRLSINTLISAFASTALGTGGTAYSPQFNSVSSSGYDSSGANFRAIAGNYGVILRNDGNFFYVLLTNSGSQTGGWNSYRPLSISVSNGSVGIDASGAGTTFGGPITAGNITAAGTVSAGAVSTASVLSTNGLTAQWSVLAGEDGGGLIQRMLGTYNGTTYAAGFLISQGSFFIVSPNSNNAYGAINGFRPFVYNIGSGAVSIDQGGQGVVLGNGSSYVQAPTVPTGSRDNRVATCAMFTNEFASSVGSAANGYQNLPTGFQIRWGTTSISGGGTAITFQPAFSHTCFFVLSNDGGASGSSPSSSSNVTSCPLLSNPNAQFYAYARNSSGAASSTNLVWIAIGY